MENTHHASESNYAARISFKRWFIPLVLLLGSAAIFLFVVHNCSAAHDLKAGTPVNMINAGE